ncbi:hypothetical protein [Rhizobium gallicum]|nr:hypothetical protein [Rhizobium gallicum]
MRVVLAAAVGVLAGRKVTVLSLPQIGAVTTCAHIRSARPVFSK